MTFMVYCDIATTHPVDIIRSSTWMRCCGHRNHRWQWCFWHVTHAKHCKYRRNRHYQKRENEHAGTTDGSGVFGMRPTRNTVNTGGFGTCKTRAYRWSEPTTTATTAETNDEYGKYEYETRKIDRLS